MVAIKPSAQLKPGEEVLTNVPVQPSWRKWFYISFAIVAYFLITVAMFHSHKLMSHHQKESMLLGSPNLLTSHHHSHHPHGHGHSHPHHHPHDHYNYQDKDWDFLIFTQHWPNTVCLQWNEKTGNGCNFPQDKDMWSIHGIWPTKTNSMGPFFCNKVKFNASLLEPIAEELNTAWIDVEKGRKQYDLWIHEWNKHGTCAMADPPLSDEFKYFSQGLKWFKQYNMENILKAYQIVPKAVEESGVSVQDIWHAVKESTGKNPVIRCEKDDKTQKTYLFEIRICFDKNLELQDCDGAKVSHRIEDFVYHDTIHTNCPLNQPILYPSVAQNELTANFGDSPKEENSAVSALKSVRSYIQSLFEMDMYAQAVARASEKSRAGRAGKTQL